MFKNRFNQITSKEWLSFQKSWFKYDGIEKLYSDNIRFFTNSESIDSAIFYHGKNYDIAKSVSQKINVSITENVNRSKHKIQFSMIDLVDIIKPQMTIKEYNILRDRLINILLEIYEITMEKRFLCIFIPNLSKKAKFYPFAWDLAKHVSTIFSLKDEKICCFDQNSDEYNDNINFKPEKKTFYCLYFRKDDNSTGIYIKNEYQYFKNNSQYHSKNKFKNSINKWFILRPQPRKKEEILHPAKFPEELVEMFIKEFSREGDNILDPMAGTGSVQVAALKLKRNAYGCELSEYFKDIAIKRCNDVIEPKQTMLNLFDNNQLNTSQFKILNKDARLISKDDFPKIDYLITSPPYWDMLNMKGAEYQAKRKMVGLRTNYSEDKNDLGNINDYKGFLDELTKIYFDLGNIIKHGSYITIIVKNIKKGGKNYPLAWDLAKRLQKKFILMPEVFWCQDDITIAPYGYGNTWVSNTFHHYCLNFQIPVIKIS